MVTRLALALYKFGLRPATLSVGLIFCLTSGAQELTDGALTYQAWRDQQVLQAQNQILRVSARISMLKSGRPISPADKDSPAVLSSNRIKKASNVDTVAAAERDLRRAQESMEAATALQFEDYINIYLPLLQNQPEAIAKLTEKLTKAELAEIAKALISKGFRPNDARRRAEGISLDRVSATSRTPFF